MPDPQQPPERGALESLPGPTGSDQVGAGARERVLANRRQFLGWSGGATVALLVGWDSSTAVAAAPRLSARNHSTVVHNVQHFLSRPDLNPPAIVIDTRKRGSLGGFVITEAHLGRCQAGPVIVDQSGRLIFFQPMSAKPSHLHRAFNVSVQRYRGKPVLAWFEGAVVADHGQGHYKLVDTSYREVGQVRAANGYQGDLHEFFLTDRGTALFTCYGLAHTKMRVSGRLRTVPYTYGVVQEVDVASGKLLFQWRSDHHVPLADSHMPVLQPGGKVWDYFHINSISVDPSDQNLVISSRNTWTVYKVDRRTGRVLWRLGGRHNEFHMGAGSHFAFQHDVKLHPGGVMTIFDNEGGPPREASQSRALVLSVDERRRKVRLLHAYHHHPPIYSDVLGSVQPVGHGNTFVGWGRAAAFTQFSRSGRVLFDGHLAGGVSSYRAFLQQWSARPASPPAIAVRRSGSLAKLYASWNGATELASWSVLGGHSAKGLLPVGSTPVKGFETEIRVPNAPAWLAVSAYDRNGVLLGTSASIRA